MKNTFWKNKTVLITGHTGFKGSWLALWLSSLKAKVIGVALAPHTQPNLFNLCHTNEEIDSHIGDIRDYHVLSQLIHKYRPQIIFHLAAQPLVRYSYQNPIETYATNVMGTVHLLDAVRQENYKTVVINVTSDKCYENKEWHWGYRENEALGGHDPYSNSKGCAELVTSAYRNSFFNPNEFGLSHEVGLASARAGNVIGGGDWATDRLIPDIIEACFQGKPVKIRHPHAFRPWQHVLEPLHGYLRLAQCVYEDPQGYAEAWNFGPAEHEAKPVSYIADTILTFFKHAPSWETDKASKPHEATFLKLDCSKARIKLKWQPVWTLEQALEETVNWYLAYKNNCDMRDFTLSQIANYAQKVQMNIPDMIGEK